VIMSVQDGVSELGQYQIITINRGARDGLEVGHVLASYHRGRLVTPNGQVRDEIVEDSWYKGMWWNSLRWGETKPVPVVPDPPGTTYQSGDTTKAGASLEGSAIRLPDERNGLVIVFRVFEKMSYGLVVKASKPIYVGDLLLTP